MSRFIQTTLADADSLVVTISLRHICSPAAFADRLAQALAFPQPCSNADALNDLMRDLEWQPETHIRIRFDHLCELQSANPMFARYIADSLALWHDYWQQHNDKRVQIDF